MKKKTEAVDTVNDFKGCPLPEYFQKEVKG